AKNSYSFVDLLERARRGAEPEWVNKVPALAQRIERIFTDERARGLNPHVRIGINGNEVYHDDLRRCIRNSRDIRELQAELARGRKLPEIFNTPDVRRALGLAAEAA